MAEEKTSKIQSSDVYSIGRIDYIEPNDLNTTQNGIPNPYEDYSMFVNLEVLLPDRSSCGIVGPKSLNYSTTNGTLSFFSGTNGKLTTNYTDATNNGNTEENTTECVGIQDISISYTTNFVPEVNIKFVDARGLSFFAPQEKAYIDKLKKKGNTPYDPEYAGSFISSIFMIPSPTFILRVRGFYGRTISLRLERSSVKVTFDNTLGNFVIDAGFIGQMFGVYADLPMSYIIMAPYLDYVGKEYWRNNTETLGIFNFKSSNSGVSPMKTFIEYKQKLRGFNGDLTKDGGNEATDEERKTKNKISYIKKIEEKHSSFLLTLALELNRDKKFLESKEDKYKNFTFFVSDIEREDNEQFKTSLSEKIKFKELSNLINEYNDRCKDGLYPPPCFKSIEDFFSQIHCAENIEISIKPEEVIIPASETNDGIERKETRYNLSLLTHKEELPEDIFKDDCFKNLAKQFDAGDLSEYTFIVPKIEYIDEGSFKNDLAERKTKFDEELKEILKFKKLNNNLQEVINILGFSPTVENYMNMIFCHMETFAESFYQCLYEIKNSQRTVESLGLSSAKTDLPGKIMRSPNAFVPPFPLIFKPNNNEKVKRDEFIRPGEEIGANSRFTKKKFQELKLVNSLYKAIRYYSSMISEADKGKELSKVISDTGGVFKNFIPSGLGDYILNSRGDNPYAFFYNFTQDEDISRDVEWLFSARLISAANTLPLVRYQFDSFDYMNQDINSEQFYSTVISFLTGIGYLEAYNFFAANPEYDKKVENFLSRFSDRDSIVDEIEVYVINGWPEGKYPGNENAFFNEKGEISWFKDTDGKHYVPLYIGGIRELGQYANNEFFSENQSGKWAPVHVETIIENVQYKLGDKIIEGKVKTREGGKNSIYISENRPIIENYNYLLENKPGTQVKGGGKYTEGAIFPYFTFNDSINSGFYQPKGEKDPNQMYDGMQIPFTRRSYGQIESAELTKPEERSYQWRSMSKKEDNKRLFPYPIFNYAFYIGANTFKDKFGEEQAREGLNWLDNWQNTTNATVCKGFDVYDEQGKQFEGNESFLRKAYIFVWSVTYNTVFGYFQGTAERTKIDLLREGAFWWRFERYIEDSADPIAMPAKYKEFNHCGPDEIFVPDDPYPSFRHKGNKGADNYKDFYNQNNFSIFTTKELGTTCGFKKIGYIDRFSKYRREALRDFFIDWAQGYEFKTIRECFEGDDSSSVIPVPDGITCNFYPFNSPEKGDKYETKVWYNKINEEGPCSRILYDLYFKVYTFVDFIGPEYSQLDWRTPRSYSRDTSKRSGDRYSLLEWGFISFIDNLKAFYNSQINGAKNSKKEDDEEAEEDEKGKDIKMSIYLTLKNLYERHFCGEEVSRWKLSCPNSDFNHFMYIDSYYNDIRDKLFLNSTYVSDSLNSLISFSSEPKEENGQGKSSIKTTTINRSVLQYMSDIIEDAGMSLNAFPLGNAMTGANTIREMFTPNPISDSPFNTDNYFMCLYPDKPSENLNLSEYTDDYGYDDDGFTIVDIADSTYSPSASLPEAFQTEDGGFRIPAFGVSYGKQNQSYFTNMTINMDSFTDTEFSIEAEQDIAVKGAQGPRESNLYGQSVYSVYSNYGYTITVESMGNMQIMPGMLFQLNNIPMFKGVYSIYNVSHSISRGNIVTTFTGGRMKKYTVPFAEIEIGPADGGIMTDGLNLSDNSNVEFSVYRDVIIEKAKKLVRKSSTNPEISVSLYQMIRSDKAISNKLSNAPSAEEEKIIYWFIDNYLLPIMTAWYDYCESNGYSSRGVTITSGFRSPQLQKKLNPRTALSAHSMGYAADLVPTNGKSGEFFSFCLNYFQSHHLKFDQLLDETLDWSHWVHIGAKRPSTGEQRCQYFKMHKHKRPSNEPIKILQV